MPFFKRTLLAAEAVLLACVSIAGAGAPAQSTTVVAPTPAQIQVQANAGLTGKPAAAPPALTQPAPAAAPSQAPDAPALPVLGAAPPASSVPPSAIGVAPASDVVWLTERRRLAREALRQELIAKAENAKSSSKGDEARFSLPPLPAGMQVAAAPASAPPAVPELHVVGVSLPDEGKPVVTLLVGASSQEKFSVGDTLPDGSVLVGADLDHLVVRRKGQKKVTSIKTE